MVAIGHSVKGNPQNCRAEDKVLCKILGFECQECEAKGEPFRRDRVALAWNRMAAKRR